jgi:hypothetical protein
VVLQIINVTLHSPATSLIKYTMAPSNQSITPDTHPSPTTAPTNKDLPIELWMQIFEHVRSEDYARPHSVAEYAASLDQHGDDDIAAANDIRQLERESWQRTRPLYAISRNSRAAALKLRLCLRVLQTCKEPVFASSCLEEWDALSSSSQRLLGRPEAEAGLTPQKSVALQFYPADLHESEQYERYKELHAAFRLFRMRNTAAATHYLRLDTTSRVILLFDPCWETLDLDGWARHLKEQITKFWNGKGITDGQVDVMS